VAAQIVGLDADRILKRLVIIIWRLDARPDRPANADGFFEGKPGDFLARRQFLRMTGTPFA
jgi:hypothetical protein